MPEVVMKLAFQHRVHYCQIKIWSPTGFFH